ncbi:DUF397 domain-containing protein [Streptomyces sp. WELS2]|uniref:DUF397 domain-containing protein n=1 Tax=Streptomyces sp. WELS2 TaxID=2749435 RepID=UPI0015F06112|nr:DUF397 domain-containing protein [Streptomyces sp. WELS2]
MESKWRRSSYSSDQGGNCVECAPLGDLTWQKTSYSGDQGGSCVEVAEPPCNTTVAIRDSKTPAGSVLNVGPAAFGDFVSWAATAAG